MGKTITQKIFDAHEVDRPAGSVRVLSLDRVFCHEITTPIAINDLVATGRDRVFDNTKIKAVKKNKTTQRVTKRHAVIFTDRGAECLITDLKPVRISSQEKELQ